MFDLQSIERRVVRDIERCGMFDACDGDVEVEAVCPRGEAAEEVGDIGGGETEGGVGACTSGDESGLSGG